MAKRNQCRCTFKGGTRCDVRTTRSNQVCLRCEDCRECREFNRYLVKKAK